MEPWQSGPPREENDQCYWICNFIPLHPFIISIRFICMIDWEYPTQRKTESEPAGIWLDCHKRIFYSETVPIVGLPLNEQSSRCCPSEFSFWLLCSWKGEAMPHRTERCRGIRLEMWYRPWTTHRFRPENTQTTTSTPWCREVNSSSPLEIRNAAVPKSIHHNLRTHQFIESIRWRQCNRSSNRMPTI